MNYKLLMVSQTASVQLNPNMVGQPDVTINGGDVQVNKFINDIALQRHWGRNVDI